MSQPPLVGAAARDEFSDLGDLVASVRELMRASASTSATGAQMRAAAAAIRAVGADLSLAPNPRTHKIRLLADEVAQVRAGAPWQCFPFNPLGIPFPITISGLSGHGELTPDFLFEGPPDYLHG